MLPPPCYHPTCRASGIKLTWLNVFGGEVVTSRYFHRKAVLSLHWINWIDQDTHMETAIPNTNLSVTLPVMLFQAAHEPRGALALHLVACFRRLLN
jgi:hypothetical protein